MAKLYAFEIARIYRESYGIFTANGILFNHESPRRGHSFVSRKITHGAAEIKLGMRKTIFSAISMRTATGVCEEYVEAMWIMLQQKEPKDLVIATGKTHSVRDFVDVVFKHAGMPLHWKVKA